jgi:hypothetical protein
VTTLQRDAIAITVIEISRRERIAQVAEVVGEEGVHEPEVGADALDQRSLWNELLPPGDWPP